MIEDRTVFDGTEKITFKLDGYFLVNDTKYGVGEVNKGKTIIKISQVPYNEDTCCGIGQTRMDWEIRTITETEMIVYHQYYTFIDNWYKLE